MRVLFTTQPFFGHWHPLVPLARALSEAGHEVAFATTPDGCSTISANGFRCFPAGQDETAPEHQARMDRMALIPGPDRGPVMWTDYFGGLWAERSLPDMLQLGRQWKPDVLVREDLEFAGAIAAECLEIPHAAVQVTAYRPFLHDLIVPNLDRLCADAGMPPGDSSEILRRYLLIYPLPLSFQDGAQPLPPTAHAIRQDGFDKSGGEELPAWVANLPALPTIYATLGTVANQNTSILQAVLVSLREEPVNLILTTGHDVDPTVFGEQPQRVHIERYIPQSLLLPYCDMAIVHGGSGTVRDAIRHGLPLVIVPVAADQYVNAGRCEALGLSRTITPDRRTPEAIREATREVLNNSSYKQRAESMRDEMRALPGIDYAIELLVRLAKERAPITRGRAGG